MSSGTGESHCPRCGAALPGDARFCPACGQASMRLTPGQILDGKYEILDKLAEGGMGEVYRARHLHLDEIRIIKVTKPDAAGEGFEPRRFQAEARLATLVRHPNVAALYDFSRLPDGSFYMVWEFIDGITLEEWLRRNGPLPAARALEVARQVLAGLGEIHAQGIVHRDLSPDNILLRESADGRLQAKIIDLGIAKRVAADPLERTGTGLFLGKLKYCSPEQAGALPRGETLDARSDLYSFGIVLYEMVAGKPPFEAQTPEAYLGQHLHAAPPPLDTRRLPAAVGPRLAAIIKRALEKNRDRRFRSAEEFRRALEELEPAAQTTVTMAAGPPHRERRPFPFAAAAGLILLAGALAIYAVIHGMKPSRSAAPAAEPTGLPETGATPTIAPPPTPEEATAGAVTSLPAAPARSRASSRSVADPSEAGRVETARSTPAPRPTMEPSESGGEVVDEVVEPPAKMDERGATRFREFLSAWYGLPPERQSFEARALARGANRFAKAYPDDALTADLHQRLPSEFRAAALRELNLGRRRSAVRFYTAYKELEFAPADAALDRRFADLPLPRNGRTDGNPAKPN
ncbi:MAG TPA: protein kinase [Thermoanaerobaculia bacterium]|nr:protein kinase [Thermoanaerobaculia bacterium]